LIGPLGFAGKNLSRRGFHSFLAFIGLALVVTSTTFLLLLGEGLYTRLGVIISPRGTFGIDWLFFGYLLLSLFLIILIGIISVPYLVSSMINQRMKDIAIVKAAGSLPSRLFSYAFAEELLIISSSVLVGAIVALLIYLVWSWPSPNLFSNVGPIVNAGAATLLIVPAGSFLLSYVAARFQIGNIIKSNTMNSLTSQMSGMNLKDLGKPLEIRKLGSAFNLATRNVSRDRELNRTLVRIGICIFLATIVLTGALMSADTSKSYVRRALPANTLLVARAEVLNQYVSLGTAFSTTTAIPSFNYTNLQYIINPAVVQSFRNIAGVRLVDTRLFTMSLVNGYIKAHLTSNETSGNFNNEYVPEVNLGSTQALVVGIDPGNVIGDWYTSDGFLRTNDTLSTAVAGDSLIGSIVQQPFNLAQIGTLGSRYDIKSALVDPLYAGRVMYARVQALEGALGILGYNILLVKTDGSPSAIAAVDQLASSNGLTLGSMNTLLDSNLSFLDNTWSYFLILPVLAMALTSGILLGYLTTNFSRRFNDYLVIRFLGAKAWYSLRLLIWEAWGLLSLCIVVAVPLAALVSIFFILPEANISTTNLELSTSVSIGTPSLVALASALVYSRKLNKMTVKDLRG
jgi:hypothetical protein